MHLFHGFQQASMFSLDQHCWWSLTLGRLFRLHSGCQWLIQHMTIKEKQGNESLLLS